VSDVVHAATGDLELLTAAGSRAADAAAIAAGDDPAALMARAAGHLARTVIATAGHAYGLRVDLVVGRGDNGGDGWVAAPLLAQRGARVRVIAPDGTDVAISPSAAAGRSAWLASGGTAVTGDVRTALVSDDGRARADIVVDCLLGTGVHGELRPEIRDATAAIATARDGGALVVACDVPTGVSADDGSALEGAVVADVTLSLGGFKLGLLLSPGAQYAGDVQVGRLGPRFAPVAPAATDEPVRWHAMTLDGARPWALDPAGDKRDRGVVLVVAGRRGSAGAAALAGMGALAAGAGLVTIAVPASVRSEVAGHHPAMMVIGLPEDSEGAVHRDAVHALDAIAGPGLAGFDAVVAGPGLGTGEGALAVVAHLRANAARLVLDADALNVHRDAPETLSDHGGVLVVTPHERELVRIAGSHASDSRIATAAALAAAIGAVVVAKGPATLVVGAQRQGWVTPIGGPELGTGGTGDVLAGMIGAALAAHPLSRTYPAREGAGAGGAHEGEPVARAVARAVWWHAAAGHVAASDRAGRIDAVDLLDALPSTLSALAGRPGVVDVGPAGRMRLADLVGSDAPAGADRSLR
jgi:ADP-dependent NAD(P)H-hydrate dehydratase / NAD(P)H-hydrate epimerase